MENSKLITLLQTFEPKDWRNFKNFVTSPYFNHSQEIVRLVELLASGNFWQTREQVFEKIFPHQKFDEKQLNYLFSNTLQLAQDFLATEKFWGEPLQRPFFTLAALSERRLEKHYRFLFEKTFGSLLDQPLRDAQHHFWAFKLQDLERENFDRQGQRRLHESAELAAASLDFFYLTEKLKYTCAMLNSQHVLAQPYQIGFLNAVRDIAESEAMPADAPGIAIYLRIFRMLTVADAASDFEELKLLLGQYEGKFSQVEMAILYQYAINFCLLQIQKGKQSFLEEALNLYENGIQTGVLLHEGWLSPWHFKNIIRLGLNLRRFDWTEKFIQNQTALLEPQFRSDALHYNLADLFFNTRRFNLALENLMKVEFSDVYYNLGAKVMLSKIYHETDADDALDSLLHAFRNYLRRNRIISDEVRTTYQNFISVLQELRRTQPEKLAGLRARTEILPLLTEKNWLLRQIGG